MQIKEYKEKGAAVRYMKQNSKTELCIMHEKT